MRKHFYYLYFMLALAAAIPPVSGLYAHTAQNPYKSSASDTIANYMGNVFNFTMPIAADESQEINYLVADGYTLQTNISGIDFDIRLPKVTHSKNKNIDAYYAQRIVDMTETLANVRDVISKDANDAMFIYPRADYELRQARGLASVLIIESDFVTGITFSNEGKIYSDTEVLALYGMTSEQADTAILYSIDRNDANNDISSCNIFDEDTLICTAFNAGDLSHAYLLSFENGVLSANKFIP